MSHYRKIDPRIWNDAKFRGISDHAKLAFLFLLTHPHMTAIGAMRASIPGLAAEIGWASEAFREAFLEVVEKGMAMHDETASLMWLPNFLRYNPPESPNVVKAWGAALYLLPECDLQTRVIAGAVAYLEGKSKAFTEALPEAFAKTMPYQEQEQEQEQEVNPAQGKPARFDPESLPMPLGLKAAKWSEWIAYRRKRRLSTTEQTARKQLEFLTQCLARGQPPEKIIDASITNGWQGLFELKNGNGHDRDQHLAHVAAELTGRNRADHARTIDGSAIAVD